ncbi:hypothetical protein IC757_11860 [Wenzhouxiangella sp. AB-CW3]|uniref:DUF6165 family protein n=1 Tax=Wenzhouxiangella sp. AB-CW3 TaxID=2771012 RepID=UPI00168A46F7|nr:DUF6165 family protein [Wenzhouxiangella sp. AB-CW3]QOC21732.1 hypothetical protein IC757_11860 [Wenzhouxiangella sp. AB-CW3]
MELLVPVSPGELLDKLTILDIKLRHIDDAEKLANVRREHELLGRVWQEAGLEAPRLGSLRAELLNVNQRLWQIEDDIRDCEREGRFDEAFISLARSVYIENDRRAALKREINRLLGSKIVEEKSYARYRG